MATKLNEITWGVEVYVEHIKYIKHITEQLAEIVYKILEVQDGKGQSGR